MSSEIILPPRGVAYLLSAILLKISAGPSQTGFRCLLVATGSYSSRDLSRLPRARVVSDLTELDVAEILAELNRDRRRYACLSQS